MIVADSAVALGSLVLAGLFLTGRASTTTVLLFILARAIGGAFHAPAMMAATSLMVPAEHLSRVQGVNQMLQGGIGIFTAPLGALLLGRLGMPGVMALDVATALLAVLPLLLIRIPEPERRVEQPSRAPLFPLGVAAMFMVGSFAAVANGSIAAVFQATVAPEYQGRVFTLMTSVATAMTPVGLLLATPIADLTGVRTWYVAGGMACTILGAATFLVRPILEMESLRTTEVGQG